MSIVWTIVIGLVVGLLARWIASVLGAVVILAGARLLKRKKTA